MEVAGSSPAGRTYVVASINRTNAPDCESGRCQFDSGATTFIYHFTNLSGITNRVKKYLEELLPSIKEQAQKGHFEYKYSHQEGEFVAMELRKLGFDVTEDRARVWHGAILNYEMGTEYGPESGKGHYETVITIKW